MFVYSSYNGVNLTEEHVKLLVSGEMTPFISNFLSNSGKYFFNIAILLLMKNEISVFLSMLSYHSFKNFYIGICDISNLFWKNTMRCGMIKCV